MIISKTIVAIDSDVNFLDRLNGILNDLGVLDTYDYRQIEARGATEEDVTTYCCTKMHELVSQSCSVELVLVDIVIVERDELPQDRSGLAVARGLGSMLCGVPILGITRYHKSYQLLSEISLDLHVQGILLKGFLESKDFSRRDLVYIISKAREKAEVMKTPRRTDTVTVASTAERPFQNPDDSRCL
ncbi:MAG: hypothetical protein ACRDGA_00105 [Bacteroidota bacterium]